MMRTALLLLFLFLGDSLLLDAWKLNTNNNNMKILLKSSIASVILNTFSPIHVNAFGPVEVPLKVISYKQVELCNGKKPLMPGQKAMEGLFPVCLEVEATVTNPDTKKTLEDVSVYGFVKEDSAGNSVLPNNPDFKSDAGQYAMIKFVPPGESNVKFQFVAAISQDPKKEALPGITFFKTKAVSYPGGDKFKPLDDCEIDPRSCDIDSE